MEQEKLDVKEVEVLTDREIKIRKEAFLVGYGTALQDYREHLTDMLDDIEEALKAIKDKLENETQNDEENVEQNDEKTEE